MNYIELIELENAMIDCMNKKYTVTFSTINDIDGGVNMNKLFEHRQKICLSYFDTPRIGYEKQKKQLIEMFFWINDEICKNIGIKLKRPDKLI